MLSRGYKSPKGKGQAGLQPPAESRNKFISTIKIKVWRIWVFGIMYEGKHPNNILTIILYRSDNYRKLDRVRH